MSYTIKFKHASGGKIHMNSGATSLADLFNIGSLTLTSRHNMEKGRLEYATDTEGLEKTIEKAEQAANFLSSGVNSIALLLANVNVSEVEHEVNSIAWLVAGMSELAMMINDAKSDMEYSLKITSEANLEKN